MKEKIGEVGCSTGDHLHVQHVPEELVIDILLRLPVESLVRCKAVCKTWYILITRSDFIEKHFNHYHRNNNHTRLLVYHSIPISPTQEMPGFAAFSHDSLTRLNHDLDYLRIPLNLNHIVGPVNGLVLLCHGRALKRLDNYPLALLNPAARELRTLFVPDSNQNPNMRSISHVFGFGFEPLTNDIKVVAFWDLVDRITGLTVGLINIAVYSLANDSWKHLKPYRKTRSNSPSVSFGTAYFNGACHWLSCDYEDIGLVSFDLGGEVMREMNGPQDNRYSVGAFLFVYKNEGLAIFCYRSDDLIDLMVMKEEGCWTKHFMMDLSDFHQYLQLVNHRPFGIWKNNKLFLPAHRIMQPEDDRQGYKLVLYDPITHEIEEVGVPCLFPDVNYHDVFSYNESLVSVKGGGNKSSSTLDLIQDFCSSSKVNRVDRSSYPRLAVVQN